MDPRISRRTAGTGASSAVPGQLKEATVTIRSKAGRALRSLGQVHDRARHAARRRATLIRIARVRPRSAIILCLGNICRSPYAEMALIRALNDRAFRVTSGGFIGPDRPSPREAQSAAATLGIDLSRHCSKIATADMFENHDLIVVMEPAQRRTVVASFGVTAHRVIVLGDLDPLPIQRRTIDDPYGGSEQAFINCYERIERCVQALAASL